MANNRRSPKAWGRYLTSILILGSAFALLVFMTLLRKPPEESDNKDWLQTVSVFDAVEFDGKLEIDVSGMVEPHREIEMAAQVTGDVLEKADICRAGNYVTKGTLLITIDPVSYDLTYQRLEAEKAQAEANIVELEQELANLSDSIELLQVEYNLQKQEYERKLEAGSALSASERDAALRTLNAAERQLMELKNNKRLSESRRVRLQTGIDLSDVRLKEAQLNKDRCLFRAPFDGVIVSDPVEKGDHVTVGKTVVVMEDTSRADVKCNLRFEQLQQVVKYQIPDSRYIREPMAAYQLPPTPVDITRKSDDGQMVKWAGTLDRFDGIGVDAQTKMIPCRVVVENPVSDLAGQPRALVRGMFVTVTIPLDVYQEDDEALLMFPAIAVRPGNYVWAVVDGKLRRHKVEVLDRKNTEDPEARNRMVVARVKRELLTAGMSIVTSPLAQPNPGTEVTIVDPEKESSSGDEKTASSGSSSGTGSADSGEPLTGSSSTDRSSSGDDSEPTNAHRDKGTTRS